MKIEVCLFENHTISFTVDQDNLMVNATEMAKVFGKQVNEFMTNDRTKAFIESCLKNGKSRFLGIVKDEDLYVSRQRTGTWMHRLLALKFAAWLNPDFELWVFTTIETLLYGRHIKREDSLRRTLSLQREMDELRCKTVKTGEDFDRFLQIQKSLKYEINLRRSLTIEGAAGTELFE